MGPVLAPRGSGSRDQRLSQSDGLRHCRFPRGGMDGFL